MDTERGPQFAADEKNSDFVTLSGPAGCFNAFRTYAIKHFGRRGISTCGRAALVEYLTKRGVNLEVDAVARERTILAKMAEIEALGGNPDDLLDRELQRLGYSPSLKVVEGNG